MTIKYILCGLLILVLFTITGIYFYFGPEPVLVDKKDILDDVMIQPVEAFEIAAPHIEEHGTYLWREDKEMFTRIVRQRNWYFVSQTNYPAKSLRYYMQPAIMVHVNTGEVKFRE